MHLGAGDGDAFVVALDHVQEQVEVGLLVRRLGAVAFRVGHGAADDDVGRLRALEEGKEALVVIGAALGIDVEGHRMAGADGVQADAALEAGAGAPAELALHLVFGDELVRRGRHMQEAVGVHAGDVALDAAKLGPLAGEPVGLGHGVDRREDHRMIDRLGHPLAHEKDVHAPPAQRGDVVVGGRRSGGRNRPIMCGRLA